MRSVRTRLSQPRLLLVIGLAIAVGTAYWRLDGTYSLTYVTGEDAINIAISGIGPGEVKFFSYQDHAGEKIRFLLARDSTNRIHAAVDACKRCYTYHKGYSSSDGRLICRFCGNQYKLEAMEAGLASCVPVSLPFQMVGEAVRIATAELEREHRLF